MREIDIEKEKEFENQKVTDSTSRKPAHKYYWATGIPIQRHVARTLKRIEGAKVLEIGCSSGHHSIPYAKAAASFVGIDISDKAIELANSRNLPNAEFLCVDGHHLSFGNEEFDCVIVDSLLHHLDLGQSLREISRVLRPGGSLLFREPLGTNPFFQLYRWGSPSARTTDERPFTFSDLRLLRSHFDLQDVDWFGLFSMFSAFGRKESLRRVLTGVDRILALTPVRIFFWQIAGAAVKKG